MCMLDIFQLAVQPQLNSGVHAAVELGEDEETAPHHSAKLRFGSYRVREYHPEEGDAAAGCYGGQFVGSEEVDWVIGLAVGGSEIDSELADLELVSDNDIQSHDGYHGCTKVLRYLDIEIILQML